MDEACTLRAASDESSNDQGVDSPKTADASQASWNLRSLRAYSEVRWSCEYDACAGDATNTADPDEHESCKREPLGFLAPVV